ncbi:MAG: hypothetical protein HYT21_01180 [Candidatus Nealsonbacteria bacterium]|nr:hypothetical protein [Candidatus Nealsonbacteria bacterium]
MISSKSFLITGTPVIFLLLSLYVYQVQAYTQDGFVIARYEKQIEEISRTQKGLAINFSETNSLSNLETLLKSINYQDVGRVRYIQMTGAQVAVK